MVRYNIFGWARRICRLVSTWRWCSVFNGSRPTYPDRLTVHFGDRPIQFDTSDVVTQPLFYPRYSSGRMHEEPIMEFFLSKLQPSDNFLDVGANVGFYTFMAAAFCREGLVLALEIDPQLVLGLQKTARLNEVGNLKIVSAAATNLDSQLLPYQPTAEGDLSTYRIIESAAEAGSCLKSDLLVPGFTVDTLARLVSVQFTAIKIDVEGYEIAVLEGMPSHSRSCRLLALEVHKEVIDDAGQCQRLWSFLCNFEMEFQAVECHRHSPVKRVIASVEDIQKLQSNSMILGSRDGFN